MPGYIGPINISELLNSLPLVYGVLAATAAVTAIQTVVIIRRDRLNAKLKNSVKELTSVASKAILSVLSSASEAVIKARAETERVKREAFRALAGADEASILASNTITELQTALHDLQSRNQRDPVDQVLSGLARRPGGPASLDDLLFGTQPGGRGPSFLSFSVGPDGSLTPADERTQAVLGDIVTSTVKDPNHAPFTMESLLASLAGNPDRRDAEKEAAVDFNEAHAEIKADTDAAEGDGGLKRPNNDGKAPIDYVRAEQKAGYAPDARKSAPGGDFSRGEFGDYVSPRAG